MVGPPPTRTSLPFAAFSARCSASTGSAARKWNVVPPAISMEGRGVRQDEDRAVKWRLVAPPALPVRIIGKVVQVELLPAPMISAPMLVK